MTHAITQCRICGGTQLQTVMSLGDQALTGVFPKTPDQAVTTGSRIRSHSQNTCYKNALSQIEPQFARLIDSNGEGA